jgi:hypothetical protein
VVFPHYLGGLHMANLVVKTLKNKARMSKRKSSQLGMMSTIFK